MPLEPIIEHGRKRTVDLVDEEGLMVNKVGIKPMRDETTRQGADRTTIYARYTDPRIEGEVGGKQAHTLKDLPLCGALGTVGIPVINIDGERGRRRYFLPTIGLKSLNGIDLPEWHTAHLIRRREPGKLDLQIEVDAPEHPLNYAYQGTYAYAKLVARIKELERYLILKAPRSNRRVFIHEDASDHALDQVGRFFRV